MREIAPGIYVETAYEGGNVGAVATSRGALLIDTPMLPPEARKWKWALHQSGFSAPYYGIVNTDYHPEHLLGNYLFMPTRIWGHESSLKQIAKYKTSVLEQLGNTYREQDAELADEIARVEVHDPQVCVGDHAMLYLPDRRIEIHHLNGHTPASLGVYLPAERVFFVGDNVVSHEYPMMAQGNSGAWLDTLKRLRGMEIDIIVPGTGPLCSKGDLDPLIGYISEMRERVAELFASGASRRECVDKVGMQDYLPVPEEQSARAKRRRRENVERVYSEIRAAQTKH